MIENLFLKNVFPMDCDYSIPFWWLLIVIHHQYSGDNWKHRNTVSSEILWYHHYYFSHLEVLCILKMKTILMKLQVMDMIQTKCTWKWKGRIQRFCWCFFFFNTSKYSKISYFTWKGRENPEINKGRVQFTVMKLKKVQRLT